jgi:hypothetical protein
VAPQTKRFTQNFIRNWYQSLMQEQIDTARLDALVRSQEMINKGAKAKLSTRSGEFSGWVGIGEINYRFPQARTIFNVSSG